MTLPGKGNIKPSLNLSNCFSTGANISTSIYSTVACNI